MEREASSSKRPTRYPFRELQNTLVENSTKVFCKNNYSHCQPLKITTTIECTGKENNCKEKKNKNLVVSKFKSKSASSTRTRPLKAKHESLPSESCDPPRKIKYSKLDVLNTRIASSTSKENNRKEKEFNLSVSNFKIKSKSTSYTPRLLEDKHECCDAPKNSKYSKLDLLTNTRVERSTNKENNHKEKQIKNVGVSNNKSKSTSSTPKPLRVRHEYSSFEICDAPRKLKYSKLDELTNTSNDLGNFYKNKIISPYVPKPLEISNVSKIEHTELRRVPEKPAQKLTLLRKLSERAHKTKSIVYDFKIDDLNKDYVTDVQSYLLVKEKQRALTKSLTDYGANAKFRKIVVNWLAQIQNSYNIPESVFFITINMFDYMLCNTQFKIDLYSLVAVACMGIANKFDDTAHILKVSNISKICYTKFSESAIRYVEKKIFKKLHFNINFVDPLQFLFYYMEQLNIQTTEEVLYLSQYALESFTMSIQFSNYKPSLLAAGALYLALQILKMEVYFLVKLVKHLYDRNEIREIAALISDFINSTIDKDNECYIKYSSKKRKEVVKYFNKLK